MATYPKLKPIGRTLKLFSEEHLIMLVSTEADKKACIHYC